MSGYDFSQIYPAATIKYSPGSTFIATCVGNRIVVRSSATLAIVRTWLCTDSSSTTSTFPSKYTTTPLSPPLPIALTSTSTSSSSPSANHSHTDLSSLNGIESNSQSIELDHLAWSPDGLYILAFASKSALAWVFGLAHQNLEHENKSQSGGELARVAPQGMEGLIRVEWSSSGSEILAWSDFDIRLTVYNLTNGKVSRIQNVKSNSGCHTSSPDGRYLALVERHNNKEHIGIYDVFDSYNLIRNFSLQTTNVQGIAWSPCGKWIAVWDSALSYSVHIHSPIGPRLGSFSSSSPTFSPTTSNASKSGSNTSTEPEDPGLGIRTVTWAPGGRWLALGGWDDKVRILESEGWRCVAVIGLGNRTVERGTTVWKEPADWIKDTRGRGIVQFDRATLPSTFPSHRTDPTLVNPRMGVSRLSFDSDATLLMIQLESQPTVIHIYTFLPTPSASNPEISHLVGLVMSRPVRGVEWRPGAGDGVRSAAGTEAEREHGSAVTVGRKRLALTTKTQAVYIWDGESAWVEDEEENEEAGFKGGLMEGVGVPSRCEFAAAEIQWAPDGQSMVLADKSSFCVLYEDDNDDLNNKEQAGSNRYDRSIGSSRWDGDEGLSEVLEEDEEYESYESYQPYQPYQPHTAGG